MKKVKRALCLLLAVCLIAGCLPLSASAVTTSDALTWINNNTGKSIDMDSDPPGQPYQCVDVTKKYCNDLFGWIPYGDAVDYQWNISYPSGWQRIQYYSGFVPQTGDIAVFKANYYPYTGDNAHVGIIKSATSSSFTMLHQNYCDHYYTEINTFNYGPLWGVIRPNWSNIKSISLEDPYAYNVTETNGVIHSAVWNTGYTIYGFSTQMWEKSTGEKIFDEWQNFTTSQQTASCVEISHDITADFGIKLKPNTEYEYRFYINVDGQLLFSKTEILKTVGHKSITLDDPWADGVTETNAVIHSAIRNNGYTIYGFSAHMWEKSTGEKVFDEWENFTTSQQTASYIAVSHDITSDFGKKLKPGTQYEYRFFINIDGKLVYSNTAQLTTKGTSGATLKLSFDTGTFSTISPLTKEVSAGASASFTIPSTNPTKDGYTFLGWSTSSGAASASYQPGSSIAISKDTTLYAVWKQNTTTYTLSFDTGTSKTIPALTATNEYSTKTFQIPTTILTREGYIFLGWNTQKGAEKATVWPGNRLAVNGNTTLYAVWLDNGDGDGETPDFSEEQTSGNVTINIYIINFIDVSTNAYYADAVGWAVQNDITSGTSATTFSPGAVCTRAQAVTFLWRAAGSPEPTTTANPFSDVKSSDYYYKAVLWAVENGVTSGTSATTFSPNDECTRAQIVTFLWRAAGEPLVSGGNSFGDVSSGAYYADAVEWASESNITSGTSATQFSPNMSCQRGQIVTFLYRYLG